MSISFLITSSNLLKVINSILLLFISFKWLEKISFLILVDGYLFSLNLWYIKEIIPFFVLKFSKFELNDLLIDVNSSINKIIMNFLSIDCSIGSGSLFVKAKNKTFSKFLQSDKYSNDLLMKQLLEFLKENGLEFEDFSKIFINQGPGGFSGLRGSLATAKGISLSKKINLFGYDNFIWPCAKFFNKKNVIYSLIKFREKYFFKKFDKNLKSISKIEEIKEEMILKKINTDFLVISKMTSKDVDKAILKIENLNIVDLDHKDLEFLQLKGLLNENLIKPLYLT